MNNIGNQLKEAAAVLKANMNDVPNRIEALLTQTRELQRENESLKSKLAAIEAGNLTDEAREIDGVTVLVKKVNAMDMNNLRTIVDDLKNKLGSGIVVLGAVQNDKVNIIAGVTKDLISQGYHAGKLIKEVASRCGGGGGGRPDLAQAGGKNPSQLDEALQFVYDWVKSVS
jgi:alanyl-tRNA synthetase